MSTTPSAQTCSNYYYYYYYNYNYYYYYEVALRRAWLVLGWVTVHLGTKPKIIDSAFYPPWDGKMSISFRAE